MPTSRPLEPPRTPVPLRYGVALAVVAAVTLGLSTMEVGWRAPVSLYLFAIIVATWFGGTRPGVVAAAASVLAFAWMLWTIDSPNEPVGNAVRVAFLAVLAPFIVGVVGSLQLVRDELRRNNDALRESERKLKQAERLASIGHWERDPASGRIDWSDEAGRIFGRPSPMFAVSDSELMEMIHPEDRQRRNEMLNQALETRRLYDIEYRILRPGGEVRYVHIRENADRDSPVRFGTVQDITERKRADQAIRESQQLLQQVLATLPVGVVVTDRSGDILLSNAVLKRIWGADPIATGSERRASSRGWWHDSGRKIAPDEWASARAVTEGQASLSELIDIEAFDGAKKTIQNSAAPIRNAEGAIVGAVIVNEDVTVRVLADKALREYARRLQYLSRRLLELQEDERRRLALELHDEFGQLLATINLRLHTAMRQAGEAARSSLEECISLLKQAGEQVRSLALDLRPAMLESAGLDAALRWLAEQHQKRTGIVTEIVGHLDGVPGNAGIACFRVVQEALTNAVRHARTRHVRIDLQQTESALDIAVSDAGVGFDVERVSGEAADRGSLGLLGMKERMQILGGGVEVTSQPGHGTRVHLWLPLTPAPQRSVESTE